MMCGRHWKWPPCACCQTLWSTYTYAPHRLRGSVATRGAVRSHAPKTRSAQRCPSSYATGALREHGRGRSRGPGRALSGAVSRRLSNLGVTGPAGEGRPTRPLHALETLDERRHALVEVADQTVVSDREDRRLLVFVDRRTPVARSQRPVASTDARRKAPRCLSATCDGLVIEVIFDPLSSLTSRDARRIIEVRTTERAQDGSSAEPRPGGTAFVHPGPMPNHVGADRSLDSLSDRLLMWVQQMLLSYDPPRSSAIRRSVAWPSTLPRSSTGVRRRSSRTGAGTTKNAATRHSDRSASICTCWCSRRAAARYT